MTDVTEDEGPLDHPDTLPAWLAEQRSHLLSLPAHALLLHGPSGLGQYELALSLAQSWLCEKPGREQGEPACGMCPSCQQVHSRGHTDLVVLMPETLMLSLGWPLSEKAQKDIDDKKRKASQEIRIESVREAVQFAELTSGRGRGKVILVYPAEAMNAASANALLKTLEEPQGSLRFVLATEAAHELLPTIRSRCQAFALAEPTPNQALAWLTQYVPGASPTDRETALHASGNRPMDAAKIIASGAHSVWAALPLALQKGRVDAVSGMSGAQLLDAQHKLCHDLWAVKLGAAPRFYAAQDLPKPPPARALAAWAEQLKTLSRRIDHPFKPELLIEDMVQQAKQCINSRV
ncbi:DNA polymerase III subunit delta' [Variovorax sp. PCZ-1]|uniref:DNA polymerase III subunit delta' n=1 Tax=Variovorax sp. PCZ-1 TaxID=2835533 RepID=UPI001BCD8034|nr:DNA polymerase III subunit delta' [Variovorax sp. PCZ-1]MBS7807374.1 DNA polymerase III subunit delta' [Variovorax sp. PCZ-1]